LLPAGVPERSLTEAERQKLAADLDQLNAQATAQYKAGDRLGAIDTWNRELRLRRFLGPLSEVQALGRVGEIAWRDNQVSQVRWITKRLDEILAQLVPLPVPGNTATIPPSTPTSPIGSLSPIDRTALLEALGQSYQQVRQPKSAVIAYEQVLTDARQRKDGLKVEATLITLGQLHLSWFDYPAAIAVYQELLTGARAARNQPNELAYLTQLAYIYEQAKLPEQAIAAQKELIEQYQKLNRPDAIPALKIRIADNYQQLAQLGQAEIHYQAAFRLAQPQFQFGHASDALQKLGALYRANDRLDAALRVYDFLLGIEQQAYNYYGMMAAYDQLGQIYVSRREFPQAITAFQKGLDLARQLKYREDYFTAQVQQLTRQAPR
jgi:tetratricopeptide (TPR) repeat protein